MHHHHRVINLYAEEQNSGEIVEDGTECEEIKKRIIKDNDHQGTWETRCSFQTFEHNYLRFSAFSSAAAVGVAEQPGDYGMDGQEVRTHSCTCTSTTAKNQIK